MSHLFLSRAIEETAPPTSGQPGAAGRADDDGVRPSLAPSDMHGAGSDSQVRQHTEHHKSCLRFAYFLIISWPPPCPRCA